MLAQTIQAATKFGPTALKAIGLVATLDVAIGGVLKRLNNKRAVAIAVSNDTISDLTLLKSSHEYGRFEEPPDGLVPQDKATVFGSENRDNALTGTEGCCLFQGKDFDLAIYWCNPLLGSYKAGVACAGHGQLQARPWNEILDLCRNNATEHSNSIEWQTYLIVYSAGETTKFSVQSVTK